MTPAQRVQADLAACADALDRADETLATLVPVNTPLGAATHEACDALSDAVRALRRVVVELAKT